MPNIILALETSCDETSAAIIQEGILQSNVVATQIIHQNFGGVVPELASRAHQQKIIPVIQQALTNAKVSLQALSAIAFTQGPGLLGALIVGNAFAKGLAFAQNIPLIAVHHMKAHVWANFIEPPFPSFPFLCLTVSGGHTQLVFVKSYKQMKIIGQTQDDAVGEAYDKIARMLHFPYPGGKIIDAYAQKGDPKRFSFSMAQMPYLDFSFSGIKTAVLYFLQKETKKNKDFIAQHICDLCASIQHTIVQMLLQKLEKAVGITKLTSIALAGGVAANQGLRKELQALAKKKGWKIFIPQFAFCTDNAAMVARAAHDQFLAKDFCNYQATPLPRMPF